MMVRNIGLKLEKISAILFHSFSGMERGNNCRYLFVFLFMREIVSLGNCACVTTFDVFFCVYVHSNLVFVCLRIRKKNCLSKLSIVFC